MKAREQTGKTCPNCHMVTEQVIKCPRCHTSGCVEFCIPASVGTLCVACESEGE